jgi:glutamate dehydrogenase/leucine dehydrogenase
VLFFIGGNMAAKEARIEPEDLKVSAQRAAEYRDNFEAEIGAIEEAGYEITATYNLFPWLENAAIPSATESELYEEFYAAKSNIAAIVMVDVEPTQPERANPLLHSRRAVLLETREGERAIVAVARHSSGDWGNFGGAGIYNHSGPSRLAAALAHSENLAAIMTTKAYSIGVENDLAGSKTVIDSQGWLSSPTLQFVTGMFFSPNGAFPRVITGSDAGQTAETIERMYRGSRLAGGRGGEIVGSKDGLPDTASYCYWTMRTTYAALRELHPEEELPSLEGITAAVQGIGKIGTATVEMLLDAGAGIIYLTDLKLFDETMADFAASQGLSAAEVVAMQEAMREKLAAWRYRAIHNGQQIVSVRPEEIHDQPAALFCPCATAEGDISQDKIDRLAKAGVRVILSGANGPLASLEVANYAQIKGIFIPHEAIANGGSATAAALEALRYLPEQEDWQGDYERFVKEVLVPHIERNVREKLARAQKCAEQLGLSLYEGTIADAQNWLTGRALIG